MTKRTYLQLANAGLQALGEIELTDVATARGVQSYAVSIVNDSINDLLGAELEWPFNVQSGSQLLTPGVSQYDLPSDFRSVDWLSFMLIPTDRVTNGAFPSGIASWNDISAGSGAIAHDAANLRMSLTGDASNYGEADQEISVIAGESHTLYFRNFAGTTRVNVGTSTGLSDITTESFTDTTGIGNYRKLTFTPGSTTTTVFIAFGNLSATATQVDDIKCSRNQTPRALQYLSLDLYKQRFKWKDKQLDDGNQRLPTYVFQDLNDKFGVTPLPNEDYTVEFVYWNVPTDLSANGDSSVIPERWETVLIQRIKYYMYNYRSNPALADRADKKFVEGVAAMRTELINRKDYATASTQYASRRTGFGTAFTVNQ